MSEAVRLFPERTRLLLPIFLSHRSPKSAVILFFRSNVPHHPHCSFNTGPAYLTWRKGVVRPHRSAVFFVSGSRQSREELRNQEAIMSSTCSTRGCGVWGGGGQGGASCPSLKPHPCLPPYGVSLLLLLPLLFLRGLHFWPAPVLGPGLRVLLSLRLQLFLGGPLGWGHGRSGRTRGYHDLVLPLSVGDDCAQQQGEDGHEVEVPLWAQELVQVHLRDKLLQLTEDTHTVL